MSTPAPGAAPAPPPLDPHDGVPDLRPATLADLDFALRLVDATLRPYAEATWGAWSETESRGRLSEDLLAGRSSIVQWQGQAIGLLRVDRLPTHWQLEQIFLAPEHQRRGLGTRLLRQLFSQADAAGAPIRLRVLRVNPAQQLYRRLGFEIESESPQRLYLLRWPAESGALQALGYVSSAATPMSAAELDQLLLRARARNVERGLTGVLLYADGNFMQLLEGPSEALATTYAAIRADPRHHGLIELFNRRIQRRSFGDWSMACSPAQTQQIEELQRADWRMPAGGTSSGMQLLFDFWQAQRRG